MSPEPKKRWSQFSLRGLLVLVTLSAALFGWFAWRLARARLEDQAAEAIVRAGGEVAYANQFDGGVSRLTPLPPSATWIGSRSQRAFGTDPFRRIVSVTLHDDDSMSLVSNYSLSGVEIISSSGGASVTDEGLAHLRGCKQLRVLNLEGGDVTDDGLENIRGCSRLEELWLSSTRVSDAGLQRVARLPALSVLDIRGTQVSDDGLKVIAAMPKLWLLYLDNSTLTDEGLTNLSRSSRLRNLWLGAQSSATSDLGTLAEFPALDSLTLTGSLITDERLTPLANNKQITHLQLQGCTRLTDESLLILAKMPSLQSLDLSIPPFSPRAVSEFKAKKPNCTIW
jgi:Leucine-rich repeat (LRR) protein